MATADPPLVAALGRLSPADRALLELSLRHGLPDGEVANLIDLSPSQVGARRDALLRRLATDLGSDTQADSDGLRELLAGPDADAWGAGAGGAAAAAPAAQEAPAPVDSALVAALGRLSPADRALLELSLRHGLPDGEVANLIDLSPSQVGARRDALLRRLATDLGSDAQTDGEAWRGLLAGPDADAWGAGAGGATAAPPAAREAPAPVAQEAPAAAHEAPAPAARWPELAQRARDRILGIARTAPSLALLLLPGALTAYLGFNAGGFFAGGTAAVAVLICLVLVLRATLADHPIAGYAPLGALAAALLSVFALWTLLSGTWSGAPARALIEFDRAILYVLTLVLFVSIPRSTRRLQIMLWGFAAAAVGVCVVGLASRVLPDLVSAAPNIANERLSYPVTYWNALGMLATLGMLACFHVAAAERESRPARTLGAAAVPLLAVTLFFTFSRGAIAVGAIGLVVYVVLARPRGLLSAVLAVVPPSVVAVVVAYGADMLATKDPTAPSAAVQGDRVALVTAIAITVAGLLRFGLIPLDHRLSRVRVAAGRRRVVLAVLTASVVLVVAGTSLAIDAPGQLKRQYERFVEGQIVKTGNARSRLTDTANNGRIDHWRVALDASRSDRLKGGGAGTYELAWARQRPFQFIVLDGHSLYLETLAELGIVGLGLLGGALLVLLGGLASRIRGPDRALYAAIFAMALAWLVRAGIDWDWEMPVITLWLFALGGAALARPLDARPLTGRPPPLARVVIGLLVLAIALTPALIYFSQAHLDRSVESFHRGDCPRAVDQALAATSVLSVRPEPFEILGYCDVRLGRPELALRAMEEAVERDPQTWKLRYGLALVHAVAGRDPRPAARAALRLNPREPLVRDAVKRFRTSNPREWKRRALGARLPID